MLDSDKKEFASIVGATLKTYRIEPDADVLRLWWGVLNRFSIEQVRSGFTSYVGSKEAKFIVPANIVEAIELSEPDGRIGAEEAWAIYPHDEATSAVITDEMAEAMQVAQGLLNEGDNVGARMAFKEAYNRITSANKFNGKAPRWFASLGQSKDGREQALKLAVEKGRVSEDYAMSLLPAPIHSNVQKAIGLIPLLMSDDKLTHEQNQQDKNRERMAEIKAMLAKG